MSRSYLRMTRVQVRVDEVLPGVVAPGTSSMPLQSVSAREAAAASGLSLQINLRERTDSLLRATRRRCRTSRSGVEGFDRLGHGWTLFVLANVSQQSGYDRGDHEFFVGAHDPERGRGAGVGGKFNIGGHGRAADSRVRSQEESRGPSQIRCAKLMLRLTDATGEYQGSSPPAAAAYAPTHFFAW